MLETTEESGVVPGTLGAPSSEELPALPLRIALPPPPSRHGRRYV